MTTNRTDYIKGLRTLADLLEQHDELPLPYTGAVSALTWIETYHQREFAQTFARLIPGTVKKNVRDTYFDLDGQIEGLRVTAILDRDEVCTRVVTGTREVVEEVPDPDALAAVPTVTVTKTIEDVEWVCQPLLAPRTREQEMVDAANDGFLDNAEPDVPGADDYLADVTA